jgi:hypothetical protein
MSALHVVACDHNNRSEECRAYLDQVCVDKNVDCSAPRTTTRLLDKLVRRCVYVCPSLSCSNT